MTTPSYLPPDLASQVARELPDALATEERWAIERLVERAYSSGYADGHQRGFTFGREEEARARRSILRDFQDTSAKLPTPTSDTPPWAGTISTTETNPALSVLDTPPPWETKS